MSPPRPSISVLVPVHNAGPFLEETVRSALAQSRTDLELILIDDGSTDNGVATVAAIRDARIHILRQEQKGPPAALNAGLAHARGPVFLRTHTTLSKRSSPECDACPLIARCRFFVRPR